MPPAPSACSPCLGGGANGAFGAGLLKGWTESGTRPAFKLVTGISTGALIAPFAFLGSGYDATLEDFYTTITTKDIYRERSYFAILFDPSSMTDTTPLQKIVAKQVDENVLAAVAQAHRQGRRLFIGTTNMEAGKLVIWDMGAIAASGKPGALELFRKVMLASAAIPVAFPPVFIPVKAAGKEYEEMHVDGGTAAQVFFLRASPWICTPRRGRPGSRKGLVCACSSSATASSLPHGNW